MRDAGKRRKTRPVCRLNELPLGRLLCYPISNFCFWFSIWKNDGPAHAFRFCKIRRNKISVENPMAQVRQILAQNPTTRPIGLSNRKMASVFNQVNIWLSRAGLVQPQYEVHARVRVAIDVLDYEYNHYARTQSPHLSAARLPLAVRRSGLGSREPEEHHPARVFRGYVSYESTHRAAASSSSRAGLGCLVEKMWRDASRYVSSRPD